MHSILKKIFVAAAVLTLASLAFSQTLSFSANDLDGNSVDESLFAGADLTMLNVWGTFCGPCIAEMPGLGELAAKNKSNGFQLVGIVIDVLDEDGEIDAQQIETAKMIVEKTGADYLHVVADVALFQTLLADVEAVPTTFFVDRSGRIVAEPFVGSCSQDDWQQIVDALLTAVKE